MTDSVSSGREGQRRRKHGLWFYVRRILSDIWRHPANRSRRLKTIVRSLLWQVRKRLTDRPMKVKAAGGLEILCFPDSSVSSGVIYFNGWAEIEEMEFIDAYLRPGDGFVDGGANIGLYTLLAAARVGPTGWIDAFEPSPRAAERLRRNVSHNGLLNVRVHEVALDTAPGAIDLVVGWDVSNRIASAEDFQRAGDTLRIQAVRLDDVLAGNRNYAMAKLDLEGAELRCLRGAAERLRMADPPVWQLELADHLLRKQNDGAEDVVRHLVEADFEVAVYDRAQRTLRFLGEGWRGHDNVLAVARSARDRVMARLSSGSAPPLSQASAPKPR